MTAADETQDDTLGFDPDDVTLAASDDVVTQIRAQAAKLRSDAQAVSEPAEPVRVWTAKPADSSELDSADAEDRAADSGTLARARETPGPASLIDGLAPPATTATFWNVGEQITPTPRVTPRSTSSSGLPMWMWAAAIGVLIVIAAVGISLAFATTGPVT